MTSDATWPALTYEERPWVAEYETHSTSRSERKKHYGPYRAAIAPRILDARLELPGELAALVGGASAELARFDELMGGELAHFEDLDVKVGNVHRYIEPLLAAGVLVESRDVKRNQVWRATEVLEALDAFAARAGRRTAARRG